MPIRSLLALCLGALASSAAAQTRVASGSYLGNSTNRTISGLGFEPDAVFIKGNSTDEGLVCTSDMAGNCKEATGTALVGTAVTGFLPDGFGVGIDVRANRTGTTFTWIAFKMAAGQSAEGSYAGNGADDRSVTGLGFQPDVVLVIPHASDPAIWRSSSMVGDLSQPLGTAVTLTNAIQALQADGFQIGSRLDVNRSGSAFYYLAFKVSADMKVGSYTGNGTGGRQITTPGFSPDWVWLKGSGQGDTAHRAAALGSGSQFLGAMANDPDCIEALLPTGFQVGADPLCNNSGGDTFYWAAWRDAGAAAVSGQIFRSDFESGTLAVSDAPPGDWPVVEVEPSITIAASTAAKRRGSYGMRVDDQDGQSGNHPGAHGLFSFSGSPATSGDYFARFWLRLTTSNGVGDLGLARIAGTGVPGGGGILSPDFEYPGPSLIMSGYEGSAGGGAFHNDATGVTLAVGQWYLVEFGVSGIGTANGVRTIWVDGVQVGSRTAIDWTGVAVDRFEAGLPNSNQSQFVGLLDFDDMRTSVSAPASTLKVAAPTGAGTGDCVPAGVSLETSAGVSADAPYDVVVSLASGGEGAFYSNAGCSSTTTTATIAAGANSANAFFKSSNQVTVLLSASHLDFLGGSASLNLIPGGCVGGPVQLVEDAAPLATEGVPYSLNSGGVPAVGGGNGTPVFSSCNAVPGLTVDAGSGAVAWTPAAEGAVDLCLQVSDACGSDSYSFTVLVAPPPIDLALDPIDPGSGGGRIGTRVKVTGTVAAGVGSVSEAQLDLRSQGLYLETVELDGVGLTASDGRYLLPSLQPGQARAMKITAVITAPARSEAWVSAEALSRAGTPASPTVEARLRAAPVRMGVGCASVGEVAANLAVALLALCWLVSSGRRRRLRLAPVRVRRRPGSDPGSDSSR